MRHLTPDNSYRACRNTLRAAKGAGDCYTFGVENMPFPNENTSSVVVDLDRTPETGDRVMVFTDEGLAPGFHGEGDVNVSCETYTVVGATFGEGRAAA